MAYPSSSGRGPLCSLLNDALPTSEQIRGRSHWAKSFLRRVFSQGIESDGGSRTEQEEKVYAWLYTLALADKVIAFEYVRSTERGLSFAEAARRLNENGPNAPLEYSFPNWWKILWNSFFHPFNIILIILSILAYIASDSPNGCILIIFVIISVTLRFFQEYSSSKAAMKLSEFVRSPINVQRCAGRVVQTELVVQVDQRDVVPGDIVIFEPGDLFPGDVRLLSSQHLVVSQATLTGESWATDKSANEKECSETPLLDLKNICFKGTSVVSGSGSGLVISTGTKTYMSTMFSAIGKSRPRDRFEKGIQHISCVLIGIMVLVMAVLILIDFLESKMLSESVLFGVSAACAFTPNMLPLIVNTSMAKGAVSMAKDRCIVKNLAAIREMGSMDILCIDKTGTLTMNRAIVVSHLDGWGSPNEKVLHFAFFNSYFKTNQKYPVDDAILAFVYTNGYRFQPSKWVKVNEIPFDFIRRKVSVVLEYSSTSENEEASARERFVVTKGALEDVLRICSYLDAVDKCSNADILTPKDYNRILSLADDLSNQGLGVMAVATKSLDKVEYSSIDDKEIVESGMIFLGLITFYDPPKSSAKQALWRLAEKGVKAKILTGDSLSLATRICAELGIRTTYVATGPGLEQLDNDAFHETVKRATVLARLTPSQKLRVVQSLQTVGDHVVGFLGDGINDSLAIDAANVGISVDSAVSVTKDLADIILLEKDLNVLVAGVEHGRLTFGNTMKYIKTSVVANVGAILSLLIASTMLSFEPLTPKQLLTQNLIYSIGQIAIPWDKLETDYLNTPQRWPEKGIFSFILWNGPVCSLCDIGSLLFFCFYYGGFSNIEASFFHSSWFVEGLLMQTLIYHIIRTEKVPFIQEIASWPVLCATFLVSAFGIAFPYTSVGQVMGFVNLPLSFYGFLVLLFLTYFTVGQIVKRIYILTYKKWL